MRKVVSLHLTRYTEIAILILLHLSAREDNGAITTAEIAETLDLPINHVKRIVWNLGQEGLLKNTKGRYGAGTKLGRPADEITIGTIVRYSEPSLASKQTLTPKDEIETSIQSVYNRAIEAFLQELDQHTLLDVASTPCELITFSTSVTTASRS